MHMQKIITDPTSIQIPANTLVLLCGVSRSGKTTFTRENFPSELIVCSDDILLDMAKEYPEANYSTVNCRVQDDITQKVISLGWCYKNTVVIDAIGVTTSKRLAVIDKYQNCFSKVVQIVVQPDIKIILNRAEKHLLPELQRLTLRYPEPNEIIRFWQIIQSHINDCSIAKGTDSTYVLHNTDHTSVIC